MVYRLFISIFTFFFLGFSALVSEAQNWTHFRGSDMNGHASVETAPLNWSDSANIEWKVPVKGEGWSSPVVFGNQIWLTSATDDGTEFYTLCYDFKTGSCSVKIQFLSVPIRSGFTVPIRMQHPRPA